VKRKLTIEYDVQGKGPHAEFFLYDDEDKLIDQESIDLVHIRDKLWAIGFHAQAMINENIYDDFYEDKNVQNKDKHRGAREQKG